MTIRAKIKQYQDFPEAQKCCVVQESAIKSLIARDEVYILIGKPFFACMQCIACGHKYDDDCMEIQGGSSVPVGSCDLDEGKA